LCITNIQKTDITRRPFGGRNGRKERRKEERKEGRKEGGMEHVVFM
jgi:hypothetical protein